MSQIRDLIQLRQQAENRLAVRGHSNADALPADPESLIQELHVQQIALQMQYEELQLAREQLHKTRSAYQSLFESAPVGYLVADVSGMVLDANTTLKTMLRTPSVAGRRIATYAVHPELFYFHLQQVFKNGRHIFETRLIREDGSTFDAQIMSTADNDQCRTTITDMTGLHKANHADGDVRAENTLRGELIDLIAREMRTPLSSVLAAVDLLDRYRERLSPEQHDVYLHKIRDNVWTLTQMIEQAAQISRPGIPEAKPANLRELLRQNIDSVQTDPPRVALKLDGEALIRTDAQTLYWLLHGLLENGLAYTNGPVTLHAVLQPGTLTLNVTDTGPGIPLTCQPRVYEAFYRGTNAQYIPGSGLGLTITRQAVRTLGGTISFVTGDTGTTFRVTLPLGDL